MNSKLINARYRLDEEIGRGGMGMVYRAYDDVLARQIAVKVLSDTGLGTEGRNQLQSGLMTALAIYPDLDLFGAATKEAIFTRTIIGGVFEKKIIK